MWLRRVILVVLLAVVVRHIFNFTKILGIEKTIYNHRPGDCQFVPGIDSGAEDLVLLSDGIVLISSGYLTFKDRVEGAPSGHIYAYDINRPDDGAKELKVSGDYDIKKLHPHGISAYEDKRTGKTFLFVINHQVRFDVVDIFEFHESSLSLSFISSRKDSLITSVNNLVAIGPNEFYITNEAYSLNPHLRFVEDLLLLNMGCVLFCDVTGCRRASESLNFPNGIDLSRDGRYLYVSQPFHKRVVIFERASSDNSLNRNGTIDLGTIGDNIFVDESGDLWLGCIPVGYRALAHLDNHEVRVPSQVLRVKFGSDSPPHQHYELNEVYSEDGRNLTMTTIALYHKNVLLIGTVHEKMMRCSVKAM